MRCVTLLIIMLSLVSCGQNEPEQNTSEVTEEMTPNTITTTAVLNEETEPVDLSEDFSLENLKGKTDPEDGTWKDDYSEMYFHSLNIIRKQPEQSEIELIMIVFTDQEDVSDEKAEQYVQLLYDGKRPENVEVRPFLNLRKKS